VLQRYCISGNFQTAKKGDLLNLTGLWDLRKKVSLGLDFIQGMQRKNYYKVIGVMSGTSLDGIDLMEVSFHRTDAEAWSFELGNNATIGYSSIWKQRLQDGVGFSEGRLKTLNKEYTQLLAEVISKFIHNNEIENLDAVCSHGHTILHQPDTGRTLQIGNLKEIADFVGQRVICDFRVQDVALGGQGAPLVPIGDQLLFGDFDYCLNLGGFANVSMQHYEHRIAYDICPVNIVLNKYAERLGFAFDDSGNIARSGTYSLSTGAALDAIPYYKSRPPKSLGLEWVQKNIFPLLNGPSIDEKNILRTFTHHAGLQIARQFQKGAKVLVTGGGAYNDFLLERIRYHKDVELIIPEKELVEFKEAIIFGLLGVLRLRGENNCLASVTGASHDHCGGMIYEAD